MGENRWWGRAAGFCALVGTCLAISAGADAAGSRGNGLVLAASAIVGSSALLCWLAAAGLARRRRWAVPLAAGTAALNLALGVAAGLQPAAAAAALAEQGLATQDSWLTTVLGWSLPVGCGLALFCLAMLGWSVRRGRWAAIVGG